MSRRTSKVFCPSPERLEEKTLLSAGHVAASAAAGVLHSSDHHRNNNQLIYYFKVTNQTGLSLPNGSVSWEHISNGRIVKEGKVEGPFDNGTTRLIVAGPSQNFIGDTLTLKVRASGRVHAIPNINGGSSNTGSPPPTLVAVRFNLNGIIP